MELDPNDILVAIQVQKLGPIETVPTILDSDPQALVILSSTSLRSMNYLVRFIFTNNPFGIHGLDNLYSLLPYTSENIHMILILLRHYVYVKENQNKLRLYKMV